MDFELHSLLKFNNIDCQREKFGSDLVLLNFKTGSYMNVVDPGTSVVELLIDGISPSRVLDHIAAAEPNLRAATEAFISELVANEVLVQSDETPNAKPITLELKAAPTLQIFSDMADLIKADPIHESDDSMGWPVMKTEK